MASALSRSVVATIVESPGPSAPTALVTPQAVTRELVPLKRKFVSADAIKSPEALRDVLQSMQDHTEQATKSARSLPWLGCCYWPDVVFAATTARTFTHGVDDEVRLLADCPRPTTPGEYPVIAVVSQDITNRRITVIASKACTVDLTFYPAPKATR